MGVRERFLRGAERCFRMGEIWRFGDGGDMGVG